MSTEIPVKRHHVRKLEDGSLETVVVINADGVAVTINNTQDDRADWARAGFLPQTPQQVEAARKAAEAKSAAEKAAAEQAAKDEAEEREALAELIAQRRAAKAGTKPAGK